MDRKSWKAFQPKWPMILALSKPISERSAVPSILEAHNLHAGYGEVRVLKDVSLHVAQGSITAVIGSNGAGKTTLMRTLTGLIAPEQGSITFEQADVTTLPAHIRVEKGLALIPEGRLVFPDFTVDERSASALFRPMPAMTGRHALTRCTRCSPGCESGAMSGRLAIRRRAANAGIGPRPDVEADVAPTRRAQPGPCARNGG